MLTTAWFLVFGRRLAYKKKTLFGNCFASSCERVGKRLHICVVFEVLCLIVAIFFFFNNLSVDFYIHGSVHRNSILIRSNKMQQYAGIYLLQNYSTYFGCLSHPSS